MKAQIAQRTRSLAMAAAALMLAGCGNSMLLVRDPVPTELLGYAQSSRVIELEVQDMIRSDQSRKGAEIFRNRLAEYARDRGWLVEAVPEGEEASERLRVSVELLGYDTGNRLVRYIFASDDFGGKAQLRLATNFAVEGRPAGSVMLSGEISSGFFGGSITEVLGDVAKKLAKYIDENFG